MADSMIQWTRKQLQDVTSSLRFSQHRLAEIAQNLPTPGKEFDLLAELRLSAETVAVEYLSDAILILQTASNMSEKDLHEQFRGRQASEGRVTWR